MAATARPSTVAGGTPSWSSPRPEKLTHEVLTMRRLTARAAMLHDELSRKQLAAESQRLLAWRIGLDADAHRVATAEQEHERVSGRLEELQESMLWSGGDDETAAGGRTRSGGAEAASMQLGRGLPDAQRIADALNERFNKVVSLF